MTTKLEALDTLANLSNEGSAVGAINSNSTKINTAVDNLLSRVGTSPNQMESALDMNSNSIINAGAMDISSLTIAGVPLTATALSVTGHQIYQSYTDAESSTDTGTASFLQAGDLMFMYDASGTALTTGDARTWSPFGNAVSPRHFGATGGGADEVLTCQAVIDYLELIGGGIFLVDDLYKISATLDVYGGVHYQGFGRNTGFRSFSGSGLGAPFLECVSHDSGGGDPPREYNISGSNFSIQNDAEAAGSVGLHMTNMTGGKWFNIFIYQCETGIKHAAVTYPSYESSYYNEYYAVDISSCTTGIINGSFANDNKFIGGRVNDCDIGTIDYDNSNNQYYGIAIETFSDAAHKNATQIGLTSLADTQYTSYIKTRIESASGTGFEFGDGVAGVAQSVTVMQPQVIAAISPTYNFTTTHSDYHIWDDTNFAPRGGASMDKVIAGSYSFDVDVVAAKSITVGTDSGATGALTTDTVSVNCASLPDTVAVSARVSAADTIKIFVTNPSETPTADLGTLTFYWSITRTTALDLDV